MPEPTEGQQERAAQLDPSVPFKTVLQVLLWVDPKGGDSEKIGVELLDLGCCHSLRQTMSLGGGFSPVTSKECDGASAFLQYLSLHPYISCQTFEVRHLCLTTQLKT